MSSNSNQHPGSMQPPAQPGPNKYKFNTKPTTMTSGYNQQFRAPDTNNYQFNSNRGGYQQPKPTTSTKPPGSSKPAPPPAVDEDLLDISDTELIRASQVVESQLKFINNVHHTTNNAMNIFSQLSQANCNSQFHLHPASEYHQSRGLMGPPTGLPSFGNNSILSTNPNYADFGDDDIRVEIKRLKTENMQKDGEVKILRDKLKRVEQESQRMRAERVEFMKKYQQQQEEASRNLQKQIEFKELENQFKSQEIVELTMKYKVLESSVRKSSSAMSSTPYHQPQPPVSTQQSQIVMKPKPSTAMKRQAPSQFDAASNSDTENDNPFLEVKRPLLTVGAQPKPQPNPIPSNRPPLTTTNANTKPAQKPALGSKSESFTAPATSNMSSPVFASARVPKPALAIKRPCILNTNPAITVKPTTDAPSCSNETVYLLINLLAETTNHLTKFNTVDNQSTKLRPNTNSLYQKLTELGGLIERTRHSTALFKSISGMVERIEFVSTRLNDELNKMLEICMKSISAGEDESEDEDALSSSALVKSFIDLLCLGLDTSFGVFSFRVAYLYECAQRPNSQINKLKEDFFNLVYHVLDSIDFYPFTGANKNVKIMMAQGTKRSPSSGSYSSYSTLKILTTTLDCFNRLLYWTSSSGSSELYTNLFTSIGDNAHAMNRSLSCETDVVANKDHEADDSDDNFCLYHMFYYKISTFFSEVVFSLETSDHHKLNESPSQSSQQPQMQIITTIGDDTNDACKIKNFKLEKPTSGTESGTSTTPTTPSIDSLTHIDLLTSQSIDSVIRGGTTEVAISSSSSSSSSRPANTSSPNNTNNVDLININSINSLKTEFLIKFVYYVHNWQLFESIVVKLATNSKRCCYGFRCVCFKDMLYCYLVLVDYVFNEKLIFSGSKNLLDQYLSRLSNPKSSYGFSSGPNGFLRLSLPLPVFDDGSDYKPARVVSSIELTDQKSLCTKIEENLIKQKLDEDEGSHGYLNLLVVNCFNTLWTLFNTDQIVKSDSSCPGLREFRVQKSAYLKSIKHDYRLINLYCLFKQAELNIERLSASSSHLIAHLADSLNSLRASLRAFVDESFES